MNKSRRLVYKLPTRELGFPGGLMVKNPPAKQETQVPSLGKIPGEGHGNSLLYSCLGNPMNRGAWQVAYSPWIAKELDTT